MSNKEVTIKPTNCHFCGYLCGFLATVEDGKVVDLKPDPARYPYDPKVLAGCHRWKMNLDVLDGSDRVNYPLKRVGERGSGQWERISWDQAFTEIAEKLSSLKEEHGPGTLASMIGGPHASFWPLHKFMSLFGSPNNMGIGQICWNPRIWMDILTFGWSIEADITDDTGCMVIWGTNPAESDNSLFWRTLLSLKHTDTALVVIDPRYTRVAARADLWLAPIPGTDCELALAICAALVDEDLYDEDFVSEWCYGFDELAEHLKDYTPEKMAPICGVAAEDIRRAARLFAKGPSSALVSGRGIDQTGSTVAPTHRAICCMRALTANVDRPGACAITDPSDFVQEGYLELTDPVVDELNRYCLNTPFTPLQCYDGAAQVQDLLTPFGRKIPTRYLASSHPDLVLKAMETGEPYRISAAIVEATNPVLTYADSHRMVEALKGLDLLVVMDYYLTPTALLADYVLPSAGAIERPLFQAHGGVANIAYGGPKAVNPYYERKSDYEILRGLGMALGQEEWWPEETFEEAIAMTLAPSGMDWDSYCAQGIYTQPSLFFKHLMPNAEGQAQGFATPTGKVELYSKTLESLGGDPLPIPGKRYRLCGEEFIEKAKRDHQAHVMPLITGGRKQPYNASMYFNNENYRKRWPYPVVEMSEKTAQELDLAKGDVVCLATEKGKAHFYVDTVAMRDNVLSADYGWWLPEWPKDGKRLGGFDISNVNCLTSCAIDQGEPMIGTWAYNAIDCVIYKDDIELPWREGFSPAPIS